MQFNHNIWEAKNLMCSIVQRTKHNVFESVTREILSVYGNQCDSYLHWIPLLKDSRHWSNPTFSVERVGTPIVYRFHINGEVRIGDGGAKVNALVRHNDLPMTREV